MSATATASPITRADIESKLRELQGSTYASRRHRRATGVKVAIALAVVVVLGAFVIGRRKGRRQTTIVEIRRL